MMSLMSSRVPSGARSRNQGTVGRGMCYNGCSMIAIRHSSRLARAVTLAASLVYVASTEADRVLHLTAAAAGDNVAIEQTHGPDCGRIHPGVGCPAFGAYGPAGHSPVIVRVSPIHRMIQVTFPAMAPRGPRFTPPYPVRGPPSHLA